MAAGRRITASGRGATKSWSASAPRTYQWIGPDRHPYERSKPEEPYLARSLDGGETWAIEPTPALVPPEGMYTASGPGGKASDLAEAIDFSQPGFCMTFRMTDAQKGRSWFFYSYDRGKTWKGPFNFPMLGQKAIMARTDYIVNGKRDAMVFLTAAKAAGGEGRTFMAHTNDGGLHWEFVAWTAPDPGAGFSIMPSTVRLSKTDLVTTVRHEDSQRKGPNWIDAYASQDDGKTWQYLNRPAPDTGDHSGNPPSTGPFEGRPARHYLRPPLAAIRNPRPAQLGRRQDVGQGVRAPRRRGRLGYRLYADGATGGRQTRDGLLLGDGADEGAHDRGHDLGSRREAEMTLDQSPNIRTAPSIRIELSADHSPAS